MTSLLRVWFGYRSWRATHWLAYAAWPLAFAHGVGIGTDVPSLWFRLIAFACLTAVVLAAASRVLLHVPASDSNRR